MPSVPVRLSDIDRATAYLDSISGFQNPEQHAAQWFAEARAEGETEWRERCDALTKMLREKQDAMRLEPSESAWIIAGQWIGNTIQRRRLAKMFDDFARQAVANKRNIINDDTKLSHCEEVCSNLMKMLREKQDAMEVLFDRLAKAGVDCSDLFS